MSLFLKYFSSIASAFRWPYFEGVWGTESLDDFFSVESNSSSILDIRISEIIFSVCSFLMEISIAISLFSDKINFRFYMSWAGVKPLIFFKSFPNCCNLKHKLIFASWSIIFNDRILYRMELRVSLTSCLILANSMYVFVYNNKAYWLGIYIDLSTVIVFVISAFYSAAS